jgi:hypothetical protein
MILLKDISFFKGKYVAFGQICDKDLLLKLEENIKSTREVPDEIIEIFRISV